MNTALERVPQAKTSCLHLLSRVFRLLQSTGDCLWVLNTLAMPLTFLLPTIYLAHAHTLDPTYQFCTSLPSLSIPQQLEWGKRPGEKEPGPVAPPRPSDPKPSPLFLSLPELASASGQNSKCSAPEAWPCRHMNEKLLSPASRLSALETLTYPAVSCNHFSGMVSGA